MAGRLMNGSPACAEADRRLINMLNVAELVRTFAEEFGAGEWAYLAGFGIVA